MTLTIGERLKDLRNSRHLTLEELAEVTQISRSALGKYENDDFKDISPFSVVTLAKLYGVTTDYLMGVSETKNHPNAEVHELHLSDAALEVLKSGAINNLLLCEIITNPGFQRLMVDMEIYVDRLASMQIDTINANVDNMRSLICANFSPGPNDLYCRTLELAHISNDEYFSHVILDDLIKILREIQEVHKNDPTTAPVDAVPERLLESLQKVISSDASEKQNLTEIFTGALQIDHASKKDVDDLFRILQKSELLKVTSSSRGKGTS